MEVTLVKATYPRAMPVDGANMSTSAPATGNWVPLPGIYATFQVISAAAAEVVIEVTNVDPPSAGSAAITMATITLSGAGSDGFASNAAWKWARARTVAATDVTTCLMGG